MIRIRVSASGPMFDHRADQLAQAATEEIVSTISRETQNRLVGTMAFTFRHPTPYYWTQVWTRKVSPTLHEVDDARSGQPMIYGPGLEGTGSRNKTSRFKGYKIWRHVRQLMQSQASTIAHRILAPYLSRMR